MSSKTISITIPEQLEEDLQTKADAIGISRSRFIGNILLDWQGMKGGLANECAKNQNNFCTECGDKCEAKQAEAETCAHYRAKTAA